jgi:hypothetical protein
MALKWKKSTSDNNFEFDWVRIFVMPTESGEVQIYYGDESCVVKNLSVQDIAAKFKAHSNEFSERMIFKTEVKTLIENILKENA